MGRKSAKTSPAKDKADIALLNLMKLREQVSDVESRFNILTASYVELCNEAILKVMVIKTALEEELGEIGSLDLKTANPPLGNPEARFELGLMPVDTYIRKKTAQPRGLQVLLDRAADFIELGLDKIGDGIIALGERVAGVTYLISKLVPRK